QLQPAIDELTKFMKENNDAWQTTQAGELLGHALDAKGDQAAATKLYEDLSGRADLPPESKQKFDVLSLQGLMRGDKAARDKAETKLNALAKSLPAGDPQLPRVQVYLAECWLAGGKAPEAEAKLQELIKGSGDDAVKGLARNALGDCYRTAGKHEEAFWQDLWVDVVYNQDPAEEAKALYWLSKLFLEVRSDSARAAQCRDRLLNSKEYAGLEYRVKAEKEK